MKFETEHGCVVSETATAYGNSKQIGRYAIAAAMNEVLTRAERVDQSLCTAGRKENASL